jgi:peptide chain release factor subunit 3
LALIDYQTGERIQENPRYIKQGQVAVARFELLRIEKTICIEPFARFRRLGRFTLRDDGQTVAIGNVLNIIA